MIVKPVINLLLGTACNKHCSYCMQPRHGSNGKIDINFFIKEFISYIKAHYPNGIKTIEYWGGEPLLYLDYIKAIQYAITKYDISIDRSPRIITNGTLVNDDFASFCNKSDILVNLSWHDGLISDSNLKSLLKIRKVYISSVITHQHVDLVEDEAVWNRIIKLGRCISWQVYPVHCTSHCSDACYLNMSDIDLFFNLLDSNLQKNTSLFYKYILKHLYGYYVNKSTDVIEPKCYGKRKLSIDLLGNRYFCHHIMEPSNISYNIFENSISDKRILPIQSYDRWFNTQECQSCPILEQCLGGCYLSNRHSIECYWFKKAYTFCKDKYEVQNKCY